VLEDVFERWKASAYVGEGEVQQKAHLLFVRFVQKSPKGVLSTQGRVHTQGVDDVVAMAVGREVDRREVQGVDAEIAQGGERRVDAVERASGGSIPPRVGQVGPVGGSAEPIDEDGVDRGVSPPWRKPWDRVWVDDERGGSIVGADRESVLELEPQLDRSGGQGQDGFEEVVFLLVCDGGHGGVVGGGVCPTQG
ncbi:MAG: hypothetical protein U1E22_09420, partial [Coriobacteriia bacterium]|nr:hypothetical protein [Coriobacteriia bacterium]